MYDLNDTIVAVSSPTSGDRVIVRLTGPKTTDVLQQIFSTPIPKDRNGLFTGRIAVDSELKVDAKLYLFLAPHSYTGDDVAEIHIHTNAAVTEALMSKLLSKGPRMAGPGEFTARAYLNGKMDLTQAEAVNEVVVSSNKYQLAASEKLLAGRLAQTTTKLRSELMDCLSLIEAGLDFSGEDIEFISRPDAVERLTQTKNELERLLSGSVSYEEVVDLPAVGIAGAPNAGKSSLLNKLLGKERSIVSELRKTTRDVLTGELTLAHSRCVLFDCAGLTRCSILDSRFSILDELAQQAAIEALRNSSVVVFCVDVAKPDWSEDSLIRELIEPQILIPVATKSDLLSEEVLAKRLGELNDLFGPAPKSSTAKRFSGLDTKSDHSKPDFGAGFLPISVETLSGVELLREALDRKIVELTVGTGRGSQIREQISTVALTTRHKHAVTEAIENVSEAINELQSENDEVSAMMLRAAYQGLCDIEQPAAWRADEQILERIFSRFCIGK
ncbi:MAG TPA: GTPase [Sedimentisphaerales bacterium]|nr:GTPase [Sedimentisphaerales bacterium]